MGPRANLLTMPPALWSTRRGLSPRRRALSVAIIGLCFVLSSTPLRAATPAPCALTPRAVVADDFDGDGTLDVALVSEGSSSIFLHPGTGTGGLGAVREISSGMVQPHAIVAGDFTGGGHVDLAVAGVVRSRLDGLLLDIGAVVLRGDGHGNFSISQRFLSSTTVAAFGLTRPAIVAGDFDGDGRLDLAVTNGLTKITVLFQPPGGFAGAVSGFDNFPATTTNLGAVDLADIVPGNFQGGPLDLAAALVTGPSNNVRFLPGNGGGSFPTQIALSTGGVGPRSLAAGHFNDDGFLDLAVLHFGSNTGLTSSNTVSIFLGNGAGGFTLTQALPLPSDGRGVSLVTLDFDRDDRLDLAAATFGVPAADNKVFVLRNDGTGTFSVDTTFDVPTFQLSAIAAGDFDGDGLPDLAVASYCDGKVKILLRPDAIAPTTVATVNPVPNGAGWNMTSVTVTLTATDNPGGSGVREIRYALDGGPETVVAAPPASPSFTTSFSLSTEATTTVTYHAVDNAGNVEAVKTLVVKIDKTAPTTTATPSPSPNLAGFNTTNVDVTLNATDLGGSAVKNITFSAVGAQPIAPTTVAGAIAFVPTITAEGTTTLTFFATDNADNQEVAKTLIIKIDRIAPELEARCAPPGQSPFVSGRDGATSVTLIASSPLYSGDFKRRETYRIIDGAGNQLDATFAVKSDDHSIKFALLSLAYNGGAPVVQPQNFVECEWEFEKPGQFKRLEQDLEIRYQVDIDAKFERDKNRTDIHVHRPAPETVVIRAGVVFLRLTTNNGQLGFDF